MSSPTTFTGYAVFEPNGTPKLHTFTPKPFGPYDIDVRVQFCGICGSDLHTLRAGWGPVRFPVVVGHEITGKVVKVGEKVKDFREGDYVGVGSLAFSCGGCKSCSGVERPVEEGAEGEVGFGGEEGLDGRNEQYCPRVGELYNFAFEDGSESQGGMADYVRVHENFAFRLPDSLDPAEAAPLLCAGITMYSPLKRSNLPPGSRVGIIGLGGLGHYGVQFAKTLGYKTTVLSHSFNKEADAKALGADNFIYTGAEGWEVENARSLDLIICTNFVQDMPLRKYLKALDIGGTFVLCGIPEGELPRLSWVDLAQANLAIRGSNVGSKGEIYDMLKVVEKGGVKSWVEVGKMADLEKYVKRMEKGDVKYRFVLEADL